MLPPGTTATDSLLDPEIEGDRGSAQARVGGFLSESGRQDVARPSCLHSSSEYLGGGALNLSFREIGGGTFEIPSSAFCWPREATSLLIRCHDVSSGALLRSGFRGV